MSKYGPGRISSDQSGEAAAALPTTDATVTGALSIAGIFTASGRGPHIFGTQGTTAPVLKLSTLLGVGRRWSLGINPTTSILHFGYNNTSIGNNTREDTSENALSFEYVQDFEQGGNRFMEWNLDYVSANGLTNHRFLAFSVNRSTHAGNWTLLCTSGGLIVRGGSGATVNLSPSQTGSTEAYFNSSGTLLQIGGTTATGPTAIRIGTEAVSAVALVLSVEDTNILILDGATERARFTQSGILALGTAQSSGAAAGDIVQKNAASILWNNAADSAQRARIKTTSSDDLLMIPGNDTGRSIAAIERIIANDGTASLGGTGSRGIILIENSSAQSAIFLMSGNATTELSDPGAAYSVTKDNAATTNVYRDAGTLTLTIQNKTGAQLAYGVFLFGAFGL